MKTPSLMAAPKVSDWLDLSEQGSVTVRTGKVELGQGILTAIAQTTAERLSVPADTVRVVSGITGRTPNEGYTAGSLSVPHSVVAVEAACETCVAHFRAHLARATGLAPEALRLSGGRFTAPGLEDGPDLWGLAAEIGLEVAVAETNAPPARNIASPSLPRIDLPEKIRGGGMIQDIRADAMLHGRVLRPPRFGARPDLSGLDTDERAALIVEGGFVALVDADPIALDRRATRLAARLGWQGGVPLTDAMLRPEALRALDGPVTELGEPVAPDPGHEEIVATYQRPYLMHASIGCVTALARWTDEGLAVTSQTQGPYQLRDALAAWLKLPPEAVVVTHAPGAGCYGHNGADDVAADAALIAKHHPGRTVRVSWTRAEELASAPLATAGEVTIRATLAKDGRPETLRLDIRSGTHARRPGTAPHGTLLAELHASGTETFTPPIELPPMHGFGALRNAMPPYAVRGRHARLTLVDQPGLRTSAMRGLGAHLNVLAIEGFIDELALRAGADPLDYRLGMLEDPRAQHVLRRVAEISGWAARPEVGTGEGWGIAYSRYKDRAAYVATVAQVRVGDRVQVERLWCCADAGRIVNLDGTRNQIEGGIVQSLSWALLEEVWLTDAGTLPTMWEHYPILRFPELPQIDLDMVQSGDPEPLGAGEVAVGPTTAAIVNAASHALGTRLRRLPLTRERVMEALAQ